MGRKPRYFGRNVQIGGRDLDHRLTFFSEAIILIPEDVTGLSLWNVYRLQLVVRRVIYEAAIDRPWGMMQITETMPQIRYPSIHTHRSNRGPVNVRIRPNPYYYSCHQYSSSTHTVCVPSLPRDSYTANILIRLL